VDEADDDRPYVGLENIESGTGRLLNTEMQSPDNESISTLPNESLGNAFETGDVLFGKLRPYLAKVWIAEFPGRCTTELIVMKPVEFEARFLLYTLLSREFVDAVDASTFGSKMPRADWDFIGNMRVLLPPNSKQIEIVNYLDREISQLDVLLTAKKRLLDLIVEKRLTIIRGLVTRGLDPLVHLRDSGTPWLGKIPSNWAIERSKWLFRERNERSVTGEEEMLTVSHLTGVTPRSEKDVNMFEAESNEGYKICYEGDLVINTMWAWMGAMGVSSMRGIVSPAYHVYQPNERLAPSYVDALVRTSVFAQEVNRFSKGVWSSRLRLYPEGFFGIRMPVPPLEEQRAIVARISSETAKLDALGSATQRTIALLKERRAALIAAGVKGQIQAN
jgi:type I restriction enzyme S subunit